MPGEPSRLSKSRYLAGLQCHKQLWSRVHEPEAPELLPDAAVQVHVLRGAGLQVERAEVMHLNPECRHPDLSNLFVREDVTALVEGALIGVPDELAAQRRMLEGPLPDVPIGEHC